MNFGSLDKLYLFPRYNTREDYRKAKGVEPPPYVPGNPIKNWEDPNEGQATEYGEPVGAFMMYNLSVAQTADGAIRLNADKKPFLERELVLMGQPINIPPSGPSYPDANKHEIPCPCRPLTEDEYLDVKGPFGNIPLLKSKAADKAATDSANKPFNDINSKLDILITTIQALVDAVKATKAMAAKAIKQQGGGEGS